MRIARAAPRGRKEGSMTSTSLDPEERAYPSGALRNSKRHFRAICDDGRIRSGICGIPATFFAIPARLKMHGKTLSGFVAIADDEELHFYSGRKS